MKQSFDIKRTEIDGIEVAWAAVGEGQKLAFMCQGWGTNFKMYKIVADAIGDEYTTILFDFPGFGMTQEPPESWDVPQYTAFFSKFAAAIEEQFSAESVTLIGHSFGGRVIIEYASKTSVLKESEGRLEGPSRVDNIVLIDSAGVMPDRSGSQTTRVKLYKIGKKILTNKFVHSLFPEVIDDWMSRQGSEDYRNATPVMKTVLVKAVNYDQQHLMPSISTPTLLIWGENDDATPLHDAQVMEQKFQDAGLVVIPGTGHFSYAENPVMFTNAIRAFLCR